MLNRRVVAAAIALSFLVACGGGKKGNAQGSSSTTTQPGAPSTDASGVSSTTAPGSKKSSTTVARGQATTTTTIGNSFDPPSSLPPGDFKTTASFTKACVDAGQSQVINVDTQPNVAVAYTVVYADNQNHGGNGGGKAGASGKFQDTFVVKTDAPKGKATSYITASTSDGKRSNATAAFKVGC